eukprot:1160451-Pelagomonas_calceolata.AAC.13
MLAIFYLATEQRSFRTFCPWSPPLNWHCSAARHSLLGLHAGSRAGGALGEPGQQPISSRLPRSIDETRHRAFDGDSQWMREYINCYTSPCIPARPKNNPPGELQGARFGLSGAQGGWSSCHGGCQTPRQSGAQTMDTICQFLTIQPWTTV